MLQHQATQQQQQESQQPSSDPKTYNLYYDAEYQENGCKPHFSAIHED